MLYSLKEMVSNSVSGFPAVFCNLVVWFQLPMEAETSVLALPALTIEGGVLVFGKNWFPCLNASMGPRDGWGFYLVLHKKNLNFSDAKESFS